LRICTRSIGESAKRKAIRRLHDWQTRLKAHPLHKQVLIVSLVIVAIFAIVFLQVGFLILGAIVLSGTLVGAVLKSVFARTSDGNGPKALTKQ
jgi:hypothetical protein